MRNFLLHEFDQQYEQYRHLDELRIKYITYFTAFAGIVFGLIIKEVILKNNINLPSKQVVCLLIIILSVLGDNYEKSTT
ncbi:MAG: hypothetical protein ACE5KE_09595 [Methanosarcinales archaeon]